MLARSVIIVVPSTAVVVAVVPFIVAIVAVVVTVIAVIVPVVPGTAPVGSVEIVAENRPCRRVENDFAPPPRPGRHDPPPPQKGAPQSDPAVALAFQLVDHLFLCRLRDGGSGQREGGQQSGEDLSSLHSCSPKGPLPIGKSPRLLRSR